MSQKICNSAEEFQNVLQYAKNDVQVITSFIKDYFSNTENAIEAIKFSREIFHCIVHHSLISVVFHEVVACHFARISHHIKQILMMYEPQIEKGLPLGDLQPLITVIDFCMTLMETSKSVHSNDDLQANFEEIIKAVIEALKSTLKIRKMMFRIDSFPNEALQFTQLERHSSNLTLILCELLTKISPANMGDLDWISESIAHIARALSCLANLKASVIGWRTFSSLIQIHYGSLQPPCNLNLSLLLLIEEIAEGLQTIFTFSQDHSTILFPEEKIISRILKMICFCVKIVVNICNQFEGSLQGCCRSILDLLLILHSYLGMTLIYCSENLKKLLEVQLFVAIEPLLKSVLPDPLFKKEFQALHENPSGPLLSTSELPSSKISSNEVDLLLLNLKVIYLILQNEDSSLRERWSLKLLENVLLLFPSCNAELCFPLVLPDVMHDGQAQEFVSLYTYTLSHLCGLLCSLNPSIFSKIEKKLLVGLLDYDYWRSLLISDILCFLARYGSEDLCTGYCKIILEILHLSKSSELVSSLFKLLLRLFAFLSEDARGQTLRNILPGSENKSQHDYLSIMNETNDMLLISQLKFEDSSLTRLFDRLEQLLGKLVSLKSNLILDSLDMLSPLNDFWESFPPNFRKDNSDSLNVLCGYFLQLIDKMMKLPTHCILSCSIIVELITAAAFNADILSTRDIYSLLLCVVECSQFCHEMFIPVSHLLETIAFRQFTGEGFKKEIPWMIAAVYSWLISSEDSYIHQSSLDSLMYFGQFTIHEEVIPLCLSFCKDGIDQSITQYLNSKCNLSETQVLRFLSSQTKCIKRIDILVTQNANSKISKPNLKKRKLASSDIPDYSNLNDGSAELIKECLNKARSILSSTFSCDDSSKEIITRSLSDINKLWAKFV